MIQKNVERLSGVIVLLLAVALRIYIQTQPWHTPDLSIIDDSSFFPIIVCYCLMAFGIGIIISSRRRPVSIPIVTVNYKGLLLITLWVVYCFVLQSLGYLVASFIALLLSQFLCGERRMWLILAVSAGLSLMIYIILGKMLHVSFPQGVIPF